MDVDVMSEDEMMIQAIAMSLASTQDSVCFIDLLMSLLCLIMKCILRLRLCLHSGQTDRKN